MGVQDGWRLCPRCGGVLTRVPDALECPDCGSRYYANSAPTANVLPVDAEGRVLLGRRAVEPERGKWDVLGGFLEEGEHPLDGIRRELREEAGIDVEPEAFLGAWIDVYGAGEGAQATLNLLWTGRIVAGEPVPADDVSELRWFAPDELPPPDECAFDCVARMLSAWTSFRVTAG